MDNRRRLELLEDELSVSDLLSKFDIEVEPGTRSICPVHEGKNKLSFLVKKDDKRWRCFSCGEFGGVVKLAQHLYEIKKFNEALEFLEREVGLIEEASVDGIQRNLDRALKTKDPEIDLQSVFETLFNEYNEILIDNRPRHQLYGYYLKLIDFVDNKFGEFRYSTLQENNTSQGSDVYQDCVEFLSWARQFIVFYWGCVKMHLKIYRSEGKNIRKIMHEDLTDWNGNE